MLYFSEVTNKTYKTEEELQKAEAAEAKKIEEKNALVKVRETRAKEVDAAFEKARTAEKEARETLSKFCKDYGAYHKTYRSVGEIPSFFDIFSCLFDMF